MQTPVAGVNERVRDAVYCKEAQYKADVRDHPICVLHVDGIRDDLGTPV